MVEMKPADIIDRASICLLKQLRTQESQVDELCEYSNWWGTLAGVEAASAILFFNRLLDVNGRLWDIEADIRKGLDEELGLEEIGKRAIKIRDLNKERAKIKNEIVDFFEEGYKDVKVNYA